MFGGVTGPVRTHAPQSKVLWLGIVGCLAACLVASPVSAAPGWSRPADVSRPEKVAVDTLSVIASSQGSATAVWQLYGGKNDIVESAGRQAGGSWSAPYKLFGDVRDIYISPQIAVDPVGNMTAVWDRREGRTFVVQSATRPAGGSWSVPVNLSKPGATSALVAVDPEGEATVVWLLEREGGNRSVVQSATRPAGGSWSASVDISKPGRYTQEAQIAVGPQGDATAIWARSNGRDLVVQSATRPAGGSWSAPIDISVHRGQGGFYPRLVVDSWGNATAIWEGYDSNQVTTFAIQGAKRPPGGAWSRPTDISRRTKSLGEPQIAVDPQGRSTAIWAIGTKGGEVIQSATSVRR